MWTVLFGSRLRPPFTTSLSSFHFCTSLNPERVSDLNFLLSFSFPTTAISPPVFDPMGHHLHAPSSVSPPPPTAADRPPPSATDFNSSSITVDAFAHFPNSRRRLQLDAVQTHWTDEKHRSYVDSLEASFVQQLHQNRCFHALYSKQKIRQKPNIPKVSFSELMVLEDASRPKANIGRNDPLLDSTADSPAILEDLQINHFPSGGKQCTMETPDLLCECGSCSDKRHIRNTTTPCGSSRSSQQIPPRSRDSITIITEVSDQNFVDNHPREGSSCMPITKRLKKATSDSSGNDQVVPYKRLSSER